MKPHALCASLLALSLWACGGADLDTRTFPIRYLTGPEIDQLITAYVYRDRPGAPGTFSISTDAVTVRETRDNLEKIARVLTEYDRPRPLVRLTFQLIEADGAAAREPAIADVEEELRKLFRFRGYRLVAEGLLSGVAGGEATQTLDGPGGPYHLIAEIREVRGSGDSATVWLSVHLGISGEGTVLATNVRVPVGKIAVLGNARAAPKGTLILTVHPELAGAGP